MLNRVYYGWRIVAMALFIYILVTGATIISFGVYILPVSAEFHLSRADINTGLILMNLGNAVWAPFLGRILDRAPARGVMIAGALLFAASFFGLALSHSLLLSAAILFTGVPIAMLAGGTLSITVLIARWFKALRGRAMSLAGLGMLIAVLVMPLLIGQLIEHFGWRNALMILGVGLPALLLPMALVVRDRPGPDDLEPGAAAAAERARALAAEPPKSVIEILRTPHFWMISLAAAIGLGLAQIFVVNLVPIAREHGLSMLQATSVLSAGAFGGFAGLLIVSVIADKMDKVLLLAGLMLVLAVCSALILVSSDIKILIACSVLKSVAGGTTAAVFYAVLADRFGAASFGTVRGLAQPITAAVAMICIRLSGEIYDRTGSYDSLFQGFIWVALFAAALFVSVRFTGAHFRRPAAIKAAE